MTAALLGALMILAGAPNDARAIEDSIVRLSAATSAEDAVHQIRMERNKSKFINTDYRVKRVSVGDPSIVDVVVLSPREIQLVPKAIGATNIVLWDPKGQPQAALEISVGSTFSHVEADLRRVLGSPDIRVDSAGNAVVLTGSVSSMLAAEQALIIARAAVNTGSGKGKKKNTTEVINLLEVGGGQQVMIEVTLAEMSRSLRREIGTNFAGVISDDVVFFSFIDSLLSPGS
ncbi:MAG TPA: pilus assembly protein N-terminal domain-containing protein, partial [Phycisphaerae bacterium]|nr:pilus assembly protein N-terminal domain-containing protein [Phycisphaerae bacterium]